MDCTTVDVVFRGERRISLELCSRDAHVLGSLFVCGLQWKVGNSALPLLHQRDPAAPTNTNVNLWVLWLKAIAGNGRRSSDGGLAYDMLPGGSRIIVCRPLAWLYPRLHHQNVALRTAFLDQVLAHWTHSTQACKSDHLRLDPARCASRKSEPALPHPDATTPSIRRCLLN